MAYTVLARKYRPQSFADLVGQEHVTRTLSNAIRSERVAHAFLFTGVRGVGKTTTARILAMALNCEQGPTPEPCGTCEICQSIVLGRDSDVQEMDGASNNSVEDVRRLQESIPYRPARDRFKIVIVDEVHMLSTGAFNAFLKTLEEPPDHVKFIFATTEIHKVPVTIRSRCQRYDFRLIPQQVITTRVREILGHEAIDADDGAVAIVAREAAGSMRDALTLLDQIVAFGGQNLIGEEVARVLGIADRDVVHEIAEATLGGDGATVLTRVDQLASRGLDMLHFARQLLELMRDMVVLRVSGDDTELVSMVPEERARASKIGASVDLQELHCVFSALSRVVDDVAQSGAPRTTLEMGLVRLATRPPLLPLAELIARFDALERRGGGGAGSGGGGARPQGRGGAPTSGPRGARSAPASAEPRASAPSVEAREAADTASPPREAAASAPELAKTREAAETAASREPVETESARTAGTTPKATERSAQAEPTSDTKSRSDAKTAAETKADARTESEADRTERSQADVASAPAAPSEPVLLRGDPWETLVGGLMESKPGLGAVLQHGSPVEIGPKKIVIAFERGSFFGQQARSDEARRTVAAFAERVFGVRPEVEITDQAAAGVRTIVDAKRERRDAQIKETRERALSHPTVLEAASLFSIAKSDLEVQVELE